MTATLPAKRAITVERIQGVSADQFFTEYVVPHRPVILTDASNGWRALTEWSPEFFKARYPNLPVSIDGQEYLLGAYMDLLLNSTEQAPAPYLRNMTIHKYFADIAQDIAPESPYSKPNWLEDAYFPSSLTTFMRKMTAKELFIGGVGARFPILHYDANYTHAFLTQIYGQKQFILYSPDQNPLLYLNHKGLSPINVLEEPDLERYPLFADAVASSVVLDPGETIFIPGGWPHYTRGLSTNITASVNTANSSNWTRFVQSAVLNKRPILRPLLSAYLHSVGNAKARKSP